VPDLKRIMVEGDKFFFSFSFDIGEYNGGMWWLLIYDTDCKMIFDQPFASYMFTFKGNYRKDIRKIIEYEILYPKGFIP